MRMYLNTSAWNRPFDDLSSSRVRLEAEAVAALLSAAEDGRLEIVGSDYLDFEVAQNPDAERMLRVQRIVDTCRRRVESPPRVAERARELERIGLRGVDALHVAAAEHAGVDALVTTDDRMLARVARAGAGVAIRVVLPQDALELLVAEETP